MDLQLGLAVVSRNSVTKGFDLNFSEVDEFNNNVKKRGFYEEEDNMKDVVFNDHPRMPVQTLPLLLWNYQKEERDDTVYEDNLDSSSSTVITDDDNHKIERGTNGLVGWPPINPLRKRICHRNIGICGGGGSGGGDGYCVNVENGGIAAAAASARKSSMYVKVKMEGVGIARKVDLTLHHSPQSLLQTLLTMFGKCQESIHSYVLSFQDQEGDWQLADQVPWRVLIESVQRLKLHRKTTV